MLELPLIFLSGMLGSTHCIGMCGPIVVTLGGSSPTWRNNLARQLAYNLGRVCTYATLGAIVAYCGWRLVARFPGLSVVPNYLAIAAGAVLLWQGLLATGWVRRRGSSRGSSPCLAASPFAALLMRKNASGAFLAGVLTGFLPCGLLYAFLAMAASTANMGHGALLMAAFGLGTAPLLIAAGCGAALVRGPARRYVYRIAACCVMLTGLICFGRGASALFAGEPAGRTDAPAVEGAAPSSIGHECPWCR